MDIARRHAIAVCLKLPGHLQAKKKARIAGFFRG